LLSGDERGVDVLMQGCKDGCQRFGEVDHIGGLGRKGNAVLFIVPADFALQVGG